jgi:hypothetical protein
LSPKKTLEFFFSFFFFPYYSTTAPMCQKALTVTRVAGHWC